MLQKPSRPGGADDLSEMKEDRAVLLWPDTFNNHFHPQTPRAAVEVLEDAGFQVIVPDKSLCCGRPLYDFGMLQTAKDMLREILDTLQHEIEAGTPMVGLEPSCVAVFRDELMNLFPMDEDAKRLSSQTFILSEFLDKKAPDYRVPRLRRKALVHKHCHHEHVMGFDAENSILKQLGLNYSCSIPAVAGWLAHLDSRVSTIKYHRRSANASCFPPCVGPTKKL